LNRLWQTKGEILEDYIKCNNKNKNQTNASDSESNLKQSQSSSPIPLPTKHLFLTIIYFASRILRSWVSPSDIYKWCIQGLIPYRRILDNLPLPISNKLSKQDRFMINTDRYKLNSKYPMQILYNTHILADALGLKLPNLNSVLIARAFIRDLGLPAVVWDKFVCIR
jgi:hypothetical protein